MKPSVWKRPLFWVLVAAVMAVVLLAVPRPLGGLLSLTEKSPPRRALVLWYSDDTPGLREIPISQPAELRQLTDLLCGALVTYDGSGDKIPVGQSAYEVVLYGPGEGFVSFHVPGNGRLYLDGKRWRLPAKREDALLAWLDEQRQLVLGT